MRIYGLFKGDELTDEQDPANEHAYIMYGTLDKPNELPPKGEFFCSRREDWMPEIPGKSAPLGKSHEIFLINTTTL